MRKYKSNEQNGIDSKAVEYDQFVTSNEVRTFMNLSYTLLRLLEPFAISIYSLTAKKRSFLITHKIKLPNSMQRGVHQQISIQAHII